MDDESGPAGEPISVAALVAGATLVGTALAASASSGPSITVSPDTGLSQGTEVGIDGAGFPKKAPSPGGFMECSTAAGQPTVSVTGFPTPLPVSCSTPASAAAKVGPSGKIAFTGLLIHTGTVGPPQTGADANGSGDAATDATSFPCPPFRPRWRPERAARSSISTLPAPRRRRR